MSKTYVGDVGTALIVDCGTDISDATVHVIKVTFPDGTEKEWQAEIHEINYLKYILTEEDTRQRGTYTAQAYVETPDGKWYGETFKRYVYPLGG